MIKEESDGGLFSGLTVNIGESSAFGRTKWKELAFGSEVADLECEVALPEYLSGNFNFNYSVFFKMTNNSLSKHRIKIFQKSENVCFIYIF